MRLCVRHDLLVLAPLDLHQSPLQMLSSPTVEAASLGLLSFWAGKWDSVVAGGLPVKGSLVWRHALHDVVALAALDLLFVRLAHACETLKPGQVGRVYCLPCVGVSSACITPHESSYFHLNTSELLTVVRLPVDDSSLRLRAHHRLALALRDLSSCQAAPRL